MENIVTKWTELCSKYYLMYVDADLAFVVMYL